MALFGPTSKGKAWKRVSNNSNALSNGLCTVYFSKEAGRISGVFSDDRSKRMKTGPTPGERFKTLDEWERFAYSKIHAVWSDLDGCLIRATKVGEEAHVMGRHKSWSSISNTYSFVWRTKPVKGLARDFNCLLDLGTGDFLAMLCSSNGPRNVPKTILLDNSVTRNRASGSKSTRK